MPHQAEPRGYSLDRNLSLTETPDRFQAVLSDRAIVGWTTLGSADRDFLLGELAT